MKKRSPAMVAADVVAISHLIIANLLFILGDYTKLFLGSGTLRPGRDMIYDYLDYPVYLALQSMFTFLIGLFESLPFISFVAEWFKWFFLDSADPVFRFMHAEFIIVFASLFYGILSYFIARTFLLVFGLDED